MNGIYKQTLMMKKDLQLILFDLDDLKKINDTHGHAVGDEAIKKAFDILNEIFKDYGECYRIGGDEFACLYLNNSQVLCDEKLKFVEHCPVKLMKNIISLL